MKLNENILYYRKAAKLSQEELAAQVGVSRQAVSKWELADAVPELDKLLALARVFGVTTDELLSERAPAASQEQGGPSQEEPPHIRPDAPAEDRAGRLCGLAGRLVRRFGWLAGVYVSLYGLGITVVGALARWGFQSVLGGAGQLMGGFGGGIVYHGPPGLEEEVLEQLGAATSPLEGVDGFALSLANLIILAGLLVMIAGAVLAVVLWRMGNRKR